MNKLLVIYILTVISLLLIVYFDILPGGIALLLISAVLAIKPDNTVYGGNQNKILAHIVGPDINIIRANIKNIPVIASDGDFSGYDNIIAVGEGNFPNAKFKYCDPASLDDNKKRYYRALNYDFIPLDYIITDLNDEIESPERVYFKPISKYNIKEVEKIKVLPEQEKWVGNSQISMMQCSIVGNFTGLAIYFKNDIIGLATYGDYVPENENHVKTKIYKYFISAEHQGKGYGKKALIKLISRIQGDIYLSVHSGNTAAIKLYTDVGFEKISESGDSIIMCKKIESNPY